MIEKATRDQTKNHNSQLILKTIYDSAPISRAAVARSTHLTRPTVSSQVNELIETGLVVEVGLGPSEGGKPPTLLDIDSNARNLLCVDLGNRAFRGAIINLRGQIIHKQSIPAENKQGDAAIALVFELINNLKERAEKPILGIGIGTPGLIDPQKGIIRRAVNLDWTDLPLRQILEDKYETPIYLANDAQVAALAEFMFGRARESNNVVLLKVGQGIGAGIVLNGSILSGDGFGAGEIGQVVVAAENGRLQTLESVASTKAILNAAQTILGESISWESLTAHSSPEIHHLIEQTGHFLGISTANLISVINIQHIVISGRIAQFGNDFLDSIRQTARQYTLSTMVDETTIEYSSLGNEIVLLGCSALILKHELGIL